MPKPASGFAYVEVLPERAIDGKPWRGMSGGMSAGMRANRKAAIC